MPISLMVMVVPFEFPKALQMLNAAA